jgi:transcription initiation factor IIE alpha subunit
MITQNANELDEQVFELLKRRGPLCESQLSTELLIGSREIDGALQRLKEAGVVELRPDRDESFKECEQPWGVRLIRR